MGEVVGFLWKDNFLKLLGFAFESESSDKPKRVMTRHISVLSANNHKDRMRYPINVCHDGFVDQIVSERSANIHLVDWRTVFFECKRQRKYAVDSDRAFEVGRRFEDAGKGEKCACRDTEQSNIGGVKVWSLCKSGLDGI